MSTRWSRRGEQTSQRRDIRASLRERYVPPPEERPPLSPIVIAVLILAAMTCLFICGILAVTSFKMIFPR
jgi:hypothetical protein